MSDSCPLSLNKLNLLYIANSIAWTWSEARTKLLPEHDVMKKINQKDMTDCPGMTKCLHNIYMSSSCPLSLNNHARNFAQRVKIPGRVTTTMMPMTKTTTMTMTIAHE